MSGPLKVGDGPMVDEPTAQEIAEAQRNWEQMPAADREEIEHAEEQAFAAVGLALQESEFDAELHPRGRTGKWVKKGIYDVKDSATSIDQLHTTGTYSTWGTPADAPVAPEDVPEVMGPLPLPFVGSRGVASQPFTAADLKGFGDAIRKGVERHPELLTSSESRLDHIGFSSVEGAPTSPDTVLSTGGPPGRPQAIVLNDRADRSLWVDPQNAVAASSHTAEGAMTHELGHAYFNVHGLRGDQMKMADTLLANGITIREVRDVSPYGAAIPSEALGELYGMTFMPGFQIEDPVTREKFKKLMLKVDHAPDFSFPDSPLPKE